MKGLEREYPPVISHHNEISNMNMHIICIMCIFVYDVYYVHNNICLGKPINILFLFMLLSPVTNWPKTWSPPSPRTSTTTTEIPLWWSRSACIPRRLTAQDLPRQNLSWSFVWSSGGFLSVAPKKNEKKKKTVNNWLVVSTPLKNSPNRNENKKYLKPPPRQIF